MQHNDSFSAILINDAIKIVIMNCMFWIIKRFRMKTVINISVLFLL